MLIVNPLSENPLHCYTYEKNHQFDYFESLPVVEDWWIFGQFSWGSDEFDNGKCGEVEVKQHMNGKV
jgi:hypothetical protein